MKKFFLILVSLFFLTAQSQIQTFNTPPKFKNVIQQNTNTKILSVNSGTNQLQWIDKASITGSIGTTLQQVLTAGNVANKSLTINDNSILIKRFDVANEERTILEPGQLKLMTNSVQEQAILRADDVTDYRNFQFPDDSGTLALRKFWTFRSLINQKGTGNPDQIILQNDRPINFKWTRVAAGVYVSDKLELDPEKIFFSLTLRNPHKSGECFEDYICFYDTVNAYSMNSFVIITNRVGVCNSVDDLLTLAEFELLIY